MYWCRADGGISTKVGASMPKLKTKSSAKRRFFITGTGKVLSAQTGKRHNMRKRSKRQLRNQRGTTVLCGPESVRALAYMPYGLPG